MENRSFRKGLAVAVVVLFLGISVIPGVISDNPSFDTTIYVDDDMDISSNYETDFDNSTFLMQKFKVEKEFTKEFYYNNGLLSNRINISSTDGEACSSSNICIVQNIPCFNNEYNSPSENIHNDDVNFYGTSSNHIYIVKVSSSSEINLKNFSFYETLTKEKNITIKNGFFSGMWITNGTEHYIWFGSGMEQINPDVVNFFQFKINPLINYVYDNRPNFSIYKSQSQSWWWWNSAFPAGTWYFIFSGSFYDLDEDEFDNFWKVWLNFTGNCNDLEISAYEGGKSFYIPYTGFNANIIIEKPIYFNAMLNGRTNFQINNTFLYSIIGNPLCTNINGSGFLNIRWNTPDGMKACRILKTKREIYFYPPEQENINWRYVDCISGAGGCGDYHLTTSFIDSNPGGFDEGMSNQIRLIGFDLELL